MIFNWYLFHVRTKKIPHAYGVFCPKFLLCSVAFKHFLHFIPEAVAFQFWMKRFWDIGPIHWPKQLLGNSLNVAEQNEFAGFNQSRTYSLLTQVWSGENSGSAPRQHHQLYWTRELLYDTGNTAVAGIIKPWDCISNYEEVLLSLCS